MVLASGGVRATEIVVESLDPSCRVVLEADSVKSVSVSPLLLSESAASPVKGIVAARMNNMAASMAAAFLAIFNMWYLRVSRRGMRIRRINQAMIILTHSQDNSIDLDLRTGVAAIRSSMLDAFAGCRF